MEDHSLEFYLADTAEACSMHGRISEYLCAIMDTDLDIPFFTY